MVRLVIRSRIEIKIAERLSSKSRWRTLLVSWSFEVLWLLPSRIQQRSVEYAWMWHGKRVQQVLNKEYTQPTEAATEIETLLAEPLREIICYAMPSYWLWKVDFLGRFIGEIRESIQLLGYDLVSLSAIILQSLIGTDSIQLSNSNGERCTYLVSKSEVAKEIFRIACCRLECSFGR